jgi:hypothetical protein
MIPVAKAESLISNCPARPEKVLTQNFGNGFRPNWIESRRSLRRSRSDTPYLMTRPTLSSVAIRLSTRNL